MTFQLSLVPGIALAGQRDVGSATPSSWHLLMHVCLRPVRPVLSAWHEMPGNAAPDSFAL